MNMSSLSVVDIFCGGGGFSCGFKRGGFKILVAIDNDPACAKTYKSNFPETTVVVEDIRNINGNDIIYLAKQKPLIVIGSPPCEPFTGANPNRMKDPIDRLYKDPMGQLTIEYIRIVGELKPKIFIMENVPAIIEGDLKEALIGEFKSIGYPNIYFNFLKAEDFGTPSHRLRVFISNISLRPTALKKRITVKEALRDLPPPQFSNIPNHEFVPLSDKKARKIAKIKHGKAMYFYQGYSRRLPNYIRLNPDDIAPTVLGSSRFIHPFEDRLLTVREQARLMGYPDHHIFYGGRDQQFNQVGESVPPPLSFAIAEFIKNIIVY